MSKVVLVFDEPKGCFECLASENEYYHGCRVNGKEHWEEKPKWCPLRPLPKRKQEVYMFLGEEVVWQKGVGYNECLSEITGENNENNSNS